MRTLLPVCFLLFCQASFSQELSIWQKYSPARLKADLDMLADSLETLHPAIYRYHSKEIIDRAFADAGRKITAPLTTTEFYSLVTPVIGLIGDVHTSIELPAAIHQSAAGSNILFPFDVRIIDDTIIVAANNSADSSIIPGTVILSINGIPASDIINRLAATFSSDGSNTTFKKRMAEQRFAFQYPYVYGFVPTFQITFRTPLDVILQRTLPAVNFSMIKQRRTENQERYPDILPAYPQQPFFQLEYPQTGHAILTLKSFEDQEALSPGKFREYVDSAFTEIARTNVQHLTIDLRMNDGGPSANAAWLYAWLTDKPFRFVYSLEVTPAGLARLAKNQLHFVKNKNPGNYTTTDPAPTDVPALFGLGIQAPRIHPYTGKLTVLVDGLTSSAAPQFASLVKRNKRGVLMGEETSGALSGGCGRLYSAFSLPNTGLVVTVSMVRIRFMAPSEVQPDGNAGPDIELKRDFRSGFVPK